MHATPDATSLLKPLADFYIGRALPEVRFIEAAEMPDACRQLLDHSDDMTSTLQRFHGEEIRVHVLDSRRDDISYERQVLLVTRETRRTVEFGAIEILFPLFPAGAQREILRAEMPLGAILRSFHIEVQKQAESIFRDRVRRGDERGARDVTSTDSLRTLERDHEHGRPGSCPNRRDSASSD